MYEKEQQIISHLRKDARTSLASISNDVKMPLSTTYDRINRLQQNQVIKKFTALVDFSKLGYHYHGKIALRISKRHKKELLSFLQNHPAVNSLHEINNGFDFLVEVIHKDIKEYLEFIDQLHESFEIQELHQYQIIKEIETEKFL